MSALLIGLGAMGGSIVFVCGYYYLARLWGRLSALGTLAKVYPVSCQCPPNTRMQVFYVGMMGHSDGGSVGADRSGLYVSGGYENQESFVPWEQLEIVHVGLVFTTVRERKTGVRLGVKNEFARFKDAAERGQLDAD